MDRKGVIPLPCRGDGNVKQGFAVPFADVTERVRYWRSFDFLAKLVKDFCKSAAMFADAEIGQFMQGAVKLKASAHKTVGSSAGKMMLSQHQRFQSHAGGAAGRHESAVARANDNEVILPGHAIFPSSFVTESLSDYRRLHYNAP